MITQEAKKKQAVVKFALKKGKTRASNQYGVSLSSVKRWCARYDGTWQSLIPQRRNMAIVDTALTQATFTSETAHKERRTANQGFV